MSPVWDLPPGVRHVVFVSGTRADFGKLKPLIRAVAESEAFEYQVFATGMHMLARYGRTVQEIHKSGFDNVHPFVNQDGSISSQMDIVLANTVQGLGHFVREARPDLLVIHGDRVEALAGAIVGALNNLLVAHIEGGEVSGTVDEVIRHSISKLAHIHLVANDDARDRLLQLGEQQDSIRVIGSPEVDLLLSTDLPNLDAVKARYEIPFDRYGILMYHPVTTELKELHRQAEEVVEGVLRSELDYVVIYPNNDAGSEIILHELERLRGNPRFRLIPSMRFEYFITLLKHARAIVGNSSAGVREAPVHGVPTIDIGTRQMNRSTSPHVIHVPEDRDRIAAAVASCPESVPSSQAFGDGLAAQRFLEALRSDAFWATPRQKRFRDGPVPGRDGEG
jgi:UDP-N-acetylglucosamine 2-epimerase (hydrolysing)